MNFSVKDQLSRLHHKQDQQTDKLNGLEVSFAKQQVMLEAHSVKFDEMVKSMSAMNVNMAEYNKELSTHIAGVLELREQNRLMREANKQREDAMNIRMKALERPREWRKTTAMYLTWLAGIASGLAAALHLLKIL